MGPTIAGKSNTFLYWNATLTSPTVYMAVRGTWVYQSAGSTISDQSRLLLPQSPDAVSTLAGKLGGGYHPPEKVNYADFNYPVPASAYRAQPRCYEAPVSWSYYNVTEPLVPGGSTRTHQVATYPEFASENQCSTIYDDYRPVISIPPEFSSMSPNAHAGRVLCPFTFDTDAVFFDPPKALTQADSLDGVSRPGGQNTDEATTTEEPSSQSAEPGTLPGPETPSATFTSDTTVASKTTQAQPSASSERPETSEDNGSQVQIPGPTGSSNGDANPTSEAGPQTTRDPLSGVTEDTASVGKQFTSEANPQTIKDPVSGVADDSDNSATGTNTSGVEEEDQSQVQTSARPSSGTTQSSSQDSADSQPSSDGSGSNVGSTTSRNIGEIIASALGMTNTQSAESSATGAATSDSRGDAQDPDAQDSTEGNEDSDPDGQASGDDSSSASGASTSEGSQSDNAGSTSDGNLDNAGSGSGSSGTSGDQGSGDTTSDADASADSSSGDSTSQSENAESASTGDAEKTGSSSDPNETAGDQSASATGSDGEASTDSSNGHSDSSSSGGVYDSASEQTGSSSRSGSDDDADGSQTGDESSGSSDVDSDPSGSQAGATGSSDLDSTGQFTSYTAAVVSGSGTTMTLTPAKSGGAVIADATLNPSESTNVPVIGNIVAISSGVIADGSAVAFSPIDTGAASSGVITGAVLSKPSNSAITISQASGGAAVIGSVTLSNGEQTYVSGIGDINVQPSGVVVDGSTQAYSTITSSPESNSVIDGDARVQEFTVDGKTYTASSAIDGEIVIANGLSTATVDAAGDVATLGTVILSAGTTGQLMLGSSTVRLTAASTASAFTADQDIFTAGSNGDYLIGSQTLTAGGAVTMSGTTYSRPTSGSGVVVNGVTQGLKTAQGSESVSQSTGPSSSTSTNSPTGQEGSSFVVPGATAESTTPASGGDRVSAVGVVAGIAVALALFNAM
ncbi:hypothetical protein KC332_g4853 [Hortaea werneckii]|nr:hypothetical protein KC350_g10933 [Hortaea werneckii]KAI6838306.1 hypothetical protein KC358_g4917 [Hortaea werneckii]KAI6906552.1 hypothetical protein KC348_g14601 [Hortaea werneckii]KAI6931082.1 hypothetical protein KC341_g9828 [Hortaea werneckii]KAI6965214.1 hypothetical protein KC321_g10228 [Hortaea werneckii]